MKIGMESKTGIAALSVLGTLAACLIYSNLTDSRGASPSSVPAAISAAGSGSRAELELTAAHRRVDEFRPSLLKPEVRSVSDPNVRLDLVQALNQVPAAGGRRNLFDFPKPPDPPHPGPKGGSPPVGPPTLKARIIIDPPQPSPPPSFALKYYGICTTRADGSKTAFFMDGDKILIKAEGQTFGDHYRLLRIGVNTAVVEDLQLKREQTLLLAEDASFGVSE
jgi:hypothetical protein